MSTFQLKKIAFALSLSAVITAHAAGLGTMVSNSKLGEPLNAEIELLAVAPGELSSIQAALASDQVYQDQMLEKPASYPYIKIEVGNNQKGKPVLKVSSSQPITEAFLDMLIQVDWPTGRLVKEYTLLLDPPGFNSNYVSESAGLPVASQPDASVSQPTTELPSDAAAKQTGESAATNPTSTRASQAAKRAVPAPDTQKADEAGALASPESLTTERGDTLYAIAKQMKPDHVSTEQMLAALYQSNQQAFDGNNMNRLKVGKIIRMPDRSALESINSQQAKSLIAEHHSNWLDYKNSLANVVKNAPANETGGNAQSAAGKIGSAEQKSPPPAPTGKDVLKLSAGDEKSGSQADKSAGKPSANAAQEEAIAKENAIKEEQARAAALEKQVADMKKLMELKNSTMAQAEQNAAAKTEPADKPTEPPVAATAPAAQQVPEASKPVNEVTKPPSTTPAAQPEASAAQPSFMQVLLQRLKNISPVLPWALIALPVLICIWALIRIRRKKQIDTFEDGILTSPATEMQNNTVFGDTQATSGDTSFLTDFSQSGVGGMIDAHDVDPIAEAEVYMAYGRDAQAEEILKDAIQKDPQRQELKLKLLEIYQATANIAAFGALASEMQAQVGTTDPVWAKVAAMGQKLDPDNTVYQTPDTAVEDPQEGIVLEDSEAQAYHLNFEAPALEFESSFDGPAQTVAENTYVDTVPENSAGEAGRDTEPDTPAILAQASAQPVTESVDFAEPLVSPAVQTTELSSMPALSEVDQQNTVAGDEVISSSMAEEPSQAPETTEDDTDLPESTDAALTAKALDLPSLSFEEAMTASEQPSRAQENGVTGDASLSSEDAVFESLPELSLELGGPNDVANRSDAEDGFAMDEIDFDNADEALPVMSDSAPNTAFPEISLDVASDADIPSEGEEESEEVNTKLDLIQAYIDMEDMIGAKELIEEVMSEGGERQRQRASELLAKVA